VDVKQLLMTQIFAVVVALILAYGGAMRGILFTLLFVVYFAGMMVVGLLMARRRGRPVSELADAKVLFKEENAREVMIQDEGLAEEFSAHTKMFLRSFLGFGVAMVVYWIGGMLYQRGYEALSSILGGHLAGFIYWLIVLEIAYVAAYGLGMRMSMSRTAFPVTPAKYMVTEKGIAVTGLGGFAIKFPLEGYEVILEEKRGFVEIKGEKVRLRLYTKNPRKLYDLIMRLDKRARKRAGEEAEEKQ